MEWIGAQLRVGIILKCIKNEVELMPGGEMGGYAVRENKYCEILVIVWGYMDAYDIILSIFGN